MTAEQIARWIDLSPTCYHAVQTMATLLAANGFTLLREVDCWNLAPGGRYYIIRHGTSLVAFVMAGQTNQPAPLRLCCGHTDSPTLKLKPAGVKKRRGYWVFDVAVYGSPILATWFDRDLSLAGMVSGIDGEGRVVNHLIRIDRSMARVANLAIHLNRTINDGYKINTQDELSPIWRPISQDEEESKNGLPIFRQWLLEQIVSPGPGWQAAHWDLMFFDCQPASLVGMEGEMIASARLDNLVSCFAGAQAMVDYCLGHPQGGTTIPMLACFDHEEVGSLSATGADGNLVESVVARLYPKEESRLQAMANSRMLSVDAAHGCHPNYPAQQDENHCPMINQGLVLKSNPNQRYATSAMAGGYFKGLCQAAGVAVQDFAVRTDMACGSTVGPILSARLGMATADIGVPTWAMHSIREVAGVGDIRDLTKVLTLFYGQH